MGEQLGDLIAHILRIAAHIPVFILGGRFRPLPIRVEAVNGKIGMVPVDQGIIEADSEPLRPECIGQLPQKIRP